MMSPRSWFVVAVVAWVGAGGCTHAVEDPVQALRAGLDRAMPDDRLGPGAPARLEALPDDVLARNPVVAARDRGPMRFASELVVEGTARDGRRVEVRERVRIDWNARGAWDAQLRRRVRRPSGVVDDVVVSLRWTGADFYTRLGEGDWLRGDLGREDWVRWRARLGETLPVLVQMLGPSLTRSRQGATIRLSLRRAVAGAGPDTGREIAQAWQRDHRVDEVDGEVVVDEACGCAARARLSFAATGLRGPAEGGRLDVRYHHEMTPLQSGQVATGRPPGARSAERRRVVSMIEHILGSKFELDRHPEPTP